MAGTMWKDIEFVITLLAFIVSIVALIVSAIFYFTSARELRHIGKVIIEYLQMAINNPNVKPNPGKKGIPNNWNVTLHPAEGIQKQVPDSPPLAEVEKKPH
jgi:hypothetical protein